MKLLLDTHVLLWYLLDDEQLGLDVLGRLDEDPDVFVSIVSLWEIGIKHASGKLSGPSDLTERVAECEFPVLGIKPSHAVETTRLPALHRDPFDRMLVAQARVEGLTLATRDATIPRYDVPVLVV